MPYTVAVSFDTFFDVINLPGDHRDTANARRDHIVSLLKGKMAILEAFPTGSIPRYTALRGRSDLDVVAVLHYGKHVKDKRPSEVLQAVRDALAEYRTNVRKNGQAVTLYYGTWPNVDVVPAVRIVDGAGNATHFHIPNASTEEWINSNPRAHAAAIEARASVSGPLFRQLIKMMKHWSSEHGDYLQSYHLEVMALRALTGALNDAPWDAFQFFDGVHTMIQTPLWHDGSFADDYLNYSDRDAVRNRLEAAVAKARDAWYQTYPPRDNDKAAIELWRQVLGTAFPAHG
jgi:hypothetical protein